MAGNVKVYNSEDLKFENLRKNKLTLVDFWATWCGPCRMLAPTIAKIAEEQEGKIKVGKIDVDEEPELSVKYGIASIPTLMVFKNGEVVNKSIGVIPKAAIEALLN